MDSWDWGVFLRPFLLLFLMVAIVIPIELAIWYLLPDGKIKRFLFKRIN